MSLYMLPVFCYLMFVCLHPKNLVESQRFKRLSNAVSDIVGMYFTFYKHIIMIIKITRIKKCEFRVHMTLYTMFNFSCG